MDADAEKVERIKNALFQRQADLYVECTLAQRAAEAAYHAAALQVGHDAAEVAYYAACKAANDACAVGLRDAREAATKALDELREKDQEWYDNPY
jgi:Tfp pilus assembly protein PilX